MPNEEEQINALVEAVAYLLQDKRGSTTGYQYEELSQRIAKVLGGRCWVCHGTGASRDGLVPCPECQPRSNQTLPGVKLKAFYMDRLEQAFRQAVGMHSYDIEELWRRFQTAIKTTKADELS